MKPPAQSIKPRHIEIYRYLRQRIESGENAPGDRLPSYGTLRDELGANEGTVERAYARLEREGLVERRHRVGTFVAGGGVLAATGKRERHGALGVVIPDALQKYSYYARLLGGIQAVAELEGIGATLISESASPRWEKVDGVIFTTPALHCLPTLPPGMPVVSLLHTLPVMASVVSDESGGIARLVEHLLALGHRRIGYLAARLRNKLPGVANNIGEQRLESYRQTMRAAGIQPRKGWIRPLLTREEMLEFVRVHDYFDDRQLGRSSMRKWLADSWDNLGCTAILAQNDLAAIGAIEALREVGLRVPQDVSVAGFDGLEVGDYFSPRLTTIDVALEEIAAEGTRILLRELRRPLDDMPAAADATAPRKPVVVPVELKVGESTSHVKKPGRTS